MPTTIESDILNASEFSEALRISRIPMYKVASDLEISRGRLSAFRNDRGVLDDDELQDLVDYFEENGISFTEEGDVVDDGATSEADDDEDEEDEEDEDDADDDDEEED